MQSNRVLSQRMCKVIEGSLYFLVLNEFSCALKTFKDTIKLLIMINLVYFVKLVLL